MADAHLRAGHDVIVPQYLGRTELIDALAHLAQRRHVGFVEILVMDSGSAVTERFRERRVQLSTSGRPHPQADVGERGLPAAITEAFDRLRSVETARARTHVITVTDGIDSADRALREVVSLDEGGE